MEVVFDVGFAGAEGIGDLPIRGPGGDESQDLELTTTDSDMAHATSPSRSTRDGGFGSRHYPSWGLSEWSEWRDDP